LRRALEQYLPPELIDRPKAGFTLPLDSWLRGPLRDWAAALLDPARLRREGHFNSRIVQQEWIAHQSGRRNRQLALWDILMFQAWLERNGT
jgi:asparagine synthase (glutamine-hydrolysing)